MNKLAEPGITRAIDSIQQRLTDYAFGLKYEDLSPAAIHAAKVRIIDTLGDLVGGFFGEPCRVARELAAAFPAADGAAVIGTRMKTTPDLAAFANGTTARFAELNDAYQWPGSSKGHPSDALAPVLSAAEHAQVSGRDFILSVVLSYEVYQRICDVFHNLAAFDNAIFTCLATAVASGRLWQLTPEQLAHCISMAVVPNVILRQVKCDDKSMFKAVSAGQAGRGGVFAAMLARAGMEGPHLPFEGKAGWCEHVARERFTLGAMGGRDVAFKITDSRIKPRPACASAMSSLLAAEPIAPMNIGEIDKIVVETYSRAKESVGSGERPWNPRVREDADHSIPYLVAATLMDGKVTLRTFSDAHLHNPEQRALMQKIEVVANDEFSRAFERLPQQYRARVTVFTKSGEKRVGESGGDKDDMAAAKSDTQIADKFRSLTEEVFDSRRVNTILDRLWRLEEMQNVAEIPQAFVLA